MQGEFELLGSLHALRVLHENMCYTFCCLVFVYDAKDHRDSGAGGFLVSWQLTALLLPWTLPTSSIAMPLTQSIPIVFDVSKH